MLSLTIAICIPIFSALTAYIPYKYPFKTKAGRITLPARFFVGIIVLIILGSIFLAFDTYKSSNDNQALQRSFKDSISNVLSQVKLLKKDLDSLGYKQTLNGKWVKKFPVVVDIKNNSKKNISDNGVNVESYDQKGGQTANSITNNK